VRLLYSNGRFIYISFARSHHRFTPDREVNMKSE
jgi:hypothetical protein